MSNSNYVHKMTNLKFISQYLHSNGELSHLIPQALQLDMRLLADGFGKIDSGMDQFDEMIWDWSHVRDSSDEALDAIASKIRKFILQS